MATVKEILISRLPFAATSDTAQVDTLIQSAFINCESCFGIRWVEVDCIPTETWSRVGVEENYNPIQLQLVAIMTAIALIESKAFESSNTLQENIQNGEATRLISEIKAGSTDTKFEQPNKDNLPFVANIEKLLSMLQNEAKALSGQMGCYVNGNMVQTMFSETLISSPFYVHRDC